MESSTGFNTTVDSITSQCSLFNSSSFVPPDKESHGTHYSKSTSCKVAAATKQMWMQERVVVLSELEDIFIWEKMANASGKAFPGGQSCFTSPLANFAKSSNKSSGADMLAAQLTSTQMGRKFTQSPSSQAWPQLPQVLFMGSSQDGCTR